MKKIRLVLCFLFPLCAAHAQKFVNGDLEGRVTTINTLPDGWENVPYTDPVCKASAKNWATPDLTGKFGPDAPFGIAGIPYSGSSFITGLHFKSGNSVFQEGIMQKIEGLVPGVAYEISFFQSVVKQQNAQDTSGSWVVYIDSTLAGVSDPSSSELDYNDINLKWEKRTIVFTAKRSVHTIKFLPLDDDPDIDVAPDRDGLRMGIDLVSLKKQTAYEITIASSSVRGMVSVQNNVNRKISLQVFDSSGKMVAGKDPVDPGMSQVDLRELPAGEYTFSFRIDKETYTLSYAND